MRTKRAFKMKKKSIFYHFWRAIIEANEKSFLFFRRALSSKREWSVAWFYYISIALKLASNRSKLFKNIHCWSRDVLNFGFLDEDLGKVSDAHFVYDFSTKMFLMLYSINWPNFIAWLLLLLEILCNMFIAILC